MDVCGDISHRIVCLYVCLYVYTISDDICLFYFGRNFEPHSNIRDTIPSRNDKNPLLVESWFSSEKNDSGESIIDYRIFSSNCFMKIVVRLRISNSNLISPI